MKRANYYKRFWPNRKHENVAADNPVRAIDTYVEGLDMAKLKFENAEGGTDTGTTRLPTPQAAEAVPVWVSAPHSVQSPVGGGV